MGLDGAKYGCKSVLAEQGAILFEDSKILTVPVLHACVRVCVHARRWDQIVLLKERGHMLVLNLVVNTILEMCALTVRHPASSHCTQHLSQ